MNGQRLPGLVTKGHEPSTWPSSNARIDFVLSPFDPRTESGDNERRCDPTLRNYLGSTSQNSLFLSESIYTPLADRGRHLS